MWPVWRNEVELVLHNTLPDYVKFTTWHLERFCVWKSTEIQQKLRAEKVRREQERKRLKAISIRGMRSKITIAGNNRI